MATDQIVGDLPRAQKNAIVASIPQSIVEEALVVDKTSFVNDALLSGKKEGATYVMRQTADDKLITIIAGGPGDVDVWYRQDDLTTPITPA